MDVGIQNLKSFAGRLLGLDQRRVNNPPRPDIPVAVIGDIHGRADLLEKLMGKLAKEQPNTKLVFVGDYVDRGPNSRQVLELLQELGDLAICLTGNHEVMLQEFLDDPVESGARWLRNGGRETLGSYGVSLNEEPSVEQLGIAAKEFDGLLSDGTLKWLRARPLSWQSGNLFVTHAGPDPSRSINDQATQDLVWGHRRFLRDDRTDDVWVAHGHWIVDRPTCAAGRINVETGAWRSGRLTAALIEPNGTVRFVRQS